MTQLEFDCWKAEYLATTKDSRARQLAVIREQETLLEPEKPGPSGPCWDSFGEGLPLFASGCSSAPLFYRPRTGCSG